MVVTICPLRKWYHIWLCLALSLTCIYGGGQVHYVGSTTYIYIYIYMKIEIDLVHCVQAYQLLMGYLMQDCILLERYDYNHHHHHHHVVPLARIYLTLSCHFSLSFIASGKSSGLHPVFSHSCCMYVRAGRPVFAWPYAGVHRSTSLMSLSLLLQQCPVCLARLTCIVFVMGGRWPYSWCLVRCCRQDLFNIALNILV